jgi:hypothetical protein
VVTEAGLAWVLGQVLTGQPSEREGSVGVCFHLQCHVIGGFRAILWVSGMSN